MPNKLETGEKYLSGSLGGKDGINIVLFLNKNKKKPTDPDYIGNIGLCLWVNEKRAANLNSPKGL